jgi:hypothetical protein
MNNPLLLDLDRTAPECSPTRSQPYYHYCVVRIDLPLGVLSAQLLHAAGESATPLPLSGTRAVCLAAKDEQELLKIALRLDRRQIPYKLIREPDLPWNGQAMAIGLHPTQDRKPIRRALSRLPLVTERKKDDHYDF